MNSRVFSRRSAVLAVISAVIVTLAAACGGGGSGSGPAPSHLDAGGGAATGSGTTFGGGGGTIRLESSQDITIATSAPAGANMTLPALSLDFGAHKAEILTDTIINPTEAVDDPAYRFYFKSSLIYEGNGNGNSNDDPAVTGLEIFPGATLTVTLDDIWITGDVVIGGTMTTTLDFLSLTSLDRAIWVTSSGAVTNEGSTSNAGTIRFYSASDIIVQGEIVGSGSSGMPDGWSLEMYPGGDAFVTGSMVADGFDAEVSGAGGDGGNISIYHDDSIFIDGTLSCEGGESIGTTGGGGGNMNIQAAYIGGPAGTPTYLSVSGTLRVRGGGATGGDGGNGGVILASHLSDYSGMLTDFDADLLASGGRGTGAGSSGGGGGTLDITSSNGPVDLTGSAVSRGGNGDQYGGHGGYIHFVSGPGESITIRGVAAAQAVGGYGIYGGLGGSLLFYAAEPGGTFTSSADLHVDGGDGAQYGGDGGEFIYMWETQDITGDVTYQGGSGTVTNGNPGIFEHT